MPETCERKALHVVLVEPHWHGHQGTYLRGFSRVLLEQGHRVTALCPFPDDAAAAFAREATELQTRFRAAMFKRPAPVASGTRWPELVFARRFWRETAAAVRAQVGSPPDLVYLSWLDTYIHPFLPGWRIDALFPYPWSGMYFYPGEHRRVGGRTPLARWLLSRGVPFRGRRCRALALLDEAALPTLRRRLAPRPVVLFPDLTDETPPTGSELSRQVAAAARGRRVIACLGSLSRRKGIYELMQVCRQASALPWFFVFAGKLDTVGFTDRQLRDILRFLQDRPENAFVHLQVVADGNEFNSLASAADVLYCHYLDFPHSSNLLTKAALLERPVLVSDGYCMAERVRRHRLGAAVAEGDVAAIAAGLRAVLAEPRVEGRDFSGYLERHTVAAVNKSWAELLGFATEPQR